MLKRTRTVSSRCLSATKFVCEAS